MPIVNRNSLFGLTALISLFAVGCTGRPSPIKPPKYKPTAMAAEALKLYDADGDGLLSKNELAQCPAIVQSIKKFDTDEDGNVSEDEISARVEFWRDGGVGVQSSSFRVLLDGRPLPGAEIILDPEPFMGELVPGGSCTTTKGGAASPNAPADQLPGGLTYGMRCGLYKLRVTHPEVDIPSRYNTDTQLGIEVAPDTDFYNLPTFNLLSQR